MLKPIPLRVMLVIWSIPVLELLALVGSVWHGDYWRAHLEEVENATRQYRVITGSWPTRPHDLERYGESYSADGARGSDAQHYRTLLDSGAMTWSFQSLPGDRCELHISSLLAGVPFYSEHHILTVYGAGGIDDSHWEPTQRVFNVPAGVRQYR